MERSSQPEEAPRDREPRGGGAEFGLLALVLLPALLPLWLIWQFGVNFPYWDQWTAEVPTLLAQANGTLDISELFRQTNDSRGFFPRLLRVPLALLTDFDVRYQMLVSVVIVCCAVFALHVLARQTTSAGRGWRLFLLGFASLLLFGLPQQWNWLFGIQLIVFTTPACLAGALAAAGARWRGSVRAIVCAALCTVATFTFANGLLLWPLVLVALVVPAVLSRGEGGVGVPRGLGWGALAVFVAAGGAVFTLYFYGYEPQGRWGEDEAAGPLAIAHFVATFLGAPLGKGIWSAQGAASTGFGAVLIVLLVAAVGYVALRRDRKLACAALPWVLLAGFATGSGGAAALFRATPGTERYLSTSIYFLLALAFVLWIVIEDAARRRRRWASLARAALAFAIVGALGLHMLASWTAYWHMHVSRVRRLQGKAALAWILVAPEDELLGFTVNPYLDELAPRAEGLDRAGWLQPPLVRDDRVSRIAGPAGGATGGIVTAEWDGEELLVTATARLTARAEPADVVLLCRKDEAGVPRVFALAWERLPRGETARYAEAAAAPDVDRFVRRLPAGRVPDGAWTLTAWAYDALTGFAYPLDVSLPVPR